MADIKAIFFDQDGVIIDTEKDGHRVAFNEAFKEFGYGFEWDVDCYHKLLQVAGGKERMRHYFKEEGLFPELSQEETDDLVKRLHKRKTDIFVGLIESGRPPLRPGIKRFMTEAMDRGLLLAVCTTANERSAAAVVNGMLGDISFSFVLAGDMVKKKKPDPEIYQLALEKSGFSPDQCIVVEDSRNGVLAARAAGLRVLATTNIYTEEEDLSDAAIVVTTLGDPGGEQGVLTRSDAPFTFDGVVHVDNLIASFSA
jgi:HAD superfamily hydrolase (TIGR01509 family)